MNKSESRSWYCSYAALFIAVAFSGFLPSCLGKSSQPESVKFQQYYVQGEQLYTKNCSNCHQKSGAGLGALYPPLSTSDFMKKNRSKVLCLMKYGISGSIEVNGISFNKKMSGVAALTELEIAEIATYIYNTWEHKAGLIEIAEVTKEIESCE